MRQNNFRILLLFVSLAALILAGCGVQASTYEKIEPYTLIKGEDGINIVKITEKAAERIQVNSTAVVEEQTENGSRLVVPYGALIYDTSGRTWVYTNPELLTYIRQEVAVDFIEGDKVFLTEGPETGTAVAVTAVAELYGTDTGVGK